VFSEYVKQWIEESRSGWKASTREQYDQVLKSQLLPQFGDLRLTNLSDARVRQAITTWRDGGLSARRCNLTLTVLRMIVKRGLRRRYLREDPLADIKSLQEPRVEIEPLGPPEIDTFLAACPRWWGPYFTVAFFTGCRPSELAALKWSDIDWTNHRFRIRAGRRNGVETLPKTPSSVRDIDCAPRVMEALRAQKVQQAKQRLKAGTGAPEPGQDYVFTGVHGGLIQNNLREFVWGPTLKRAGLRSRTMYQTRHSFASNALAGGESPSWVAAMLGHTTPEMLFTTYARFIPNRTRKDGSAFAAYMASGSSGWPPSTPAGRTGDLRASSDRDPE
jgi:integrase